LRTFVELVYESSSSPFRKAARMLATSNDTRIVTLNGRRYSVERDWGRPPSQLTKAMVSQIAVDSTGNVHCFRRGDPPVIVFRSDGEFLGAYGEGLIADAHGIYVDPRDRVFLVDRDAHEMIACAPDGRVLLRLGERHAPHWEAPFNHPTDAATAADGEIYVSDGYANARVHRFSAHGRLIGSWGSVGHGPGEFMCPHALWVDTEDRVLVVDRENNRVQVFDREGHWLEEWRGLCRPMDIFVDAEGVAYVTDQVPSLSAFGPDGRLLGRCRPSLNGAHGVFGDSAGNLYLAEIQPSCVTRMRLL
jgi:sugar lactone lactonase YvrE